MFKVKVLMPNLAHKLQLLAMLSTAVLMIRERWIKKLLKNQF